MVIGRYVGDSNASSSRGNTVKRKIKTVGRGVDKSRMTGRASMDRATPFSNQSRHRESS